MITILLQFKFYEIRRKKFRKYICKLRIIGLDYMTMVVNLKKIKYSSHILGDDSKVNFCVNSS